MPSKAVYDAVATQIASVFSSYAAACPIRMPNSGTPPPAGRTAFLQVDFPTHRAHQASIGSPGANVKREEGTILLTICTPAGKGVSDANTWIEALNMAFDHAQFGGIRCWTPYGAIMDDGSVDGGWYRVSLAVPYYYDSLS